MNLISRAEITFCGLFLLVVAGCSGESTGVGSSAESSQVPATTPGNNNNSGKVVIQSVGSNVNNSLYESALADPRRPLEEVARDAGRKPAQVLKFFGVRPGLRVLDISSADGYFTRIIAGIVGNNGSVIANNSGRRSTEEFQTKYREQYSSYGNVELNFEDPEDISLPDNSIDIVLLSLTVHHWHHANETGDFTPGIAMERFENIRRILKPGGIFAVIDHAAATGASRVVSDELHRIPRHILIDDVTLAGFVVEGESNIHANYPQDDVTQRWTGDPRDATKRLVIKFRKP